LKLAIVGSRTFTDYELMEAAVMDFQQRYREPVDAIVSGGAKGADTLARRYALSYDLELREFPAQWDKYGKSAGFRRNKFIVDDADALLAFYGPEGESNGTMHSVNLAKERGIPYAIYFEGEKE
jgi:hypothetical protein